MGRVIMNENELGKLIWIGKGFIYIGISIGRYGLLYALLVYDWEMIGSMVYSSKIKYRVIFIKFLNFWMKWNALKPITLSYIFLGFLSSIDQNLSYKKGCLLELLMIYLLIIVPSNILNMWML